MTAALLTTSLHSLPLLARGKVRLQNDQGETTVPAGSFAVARAGLPPLPPEAVDAEALLDWTGEPAAAPELAPDDLAAEIDAARRALAARREEVQTLRRTIQRLKGKG